MPTSVPTTVPGPARRGRIVVATGDVLQPKMAGPAIRAWQMAIALSREHDVHLVSNLACDLAHPDFDVSLVDEAKFAHLLDWCDVVVFQGNLMAQHPALRDTDKIVVADVYDPFHLEVLEQARDLAPEDRLFVSRSTVTVLNQQLRRGDFFLCASEKQRDFWLGQLAGLGRVNQATYDADESLHSLITVVPFGVSDEPPEPTRPVLRGVVPGIEPDDKVVIWGGGVYNWFDPLTLLHAVSRVRERVPNVRLYFLGLRHPNPHVGEMRMAVSTRALADELGLTGVHVFFNEDWVPYEDRQNYFLESDVGVSTHLDHVETAFSFRTRILDYFWSGLPVLCTSGDSLATMVEERGAGIAAPPGDVAALEAALVRLLTDEPFARSCGDASSRLATELRWSCVLEPVLAFCRAPHRAPDLVDPLLDPNPGPRTRAQRAGSRLRRDLAIAARGVRHGEWGDLSNRARNRLRRLRGRP